MSHHHASFSPPESALFPSKRWLNYATMIHVSLVRCVLWKERRKNYMDPFSVSAAALTEHSTRRAIKCRNPKQRFLLYHLYTACFDAEKNVVVLLKVTLKLDLLLFWRKEREQSLLYKLFLLELHKNRKSKPEFLFGISFLSQFNSSINQTTDPILCLFNMICSEMYFLVCKKKSRSTLTTN